MTRRSTKWRRLGGGAAVAGILLLGGLPAAAWETDQLTRRAEPLPDLTARANLEVDAALDVAALRASRRLGPRASPTRTLRVLARAVHHEVARDVHVPGRGYLRGLGYGAYAAWLETADLPRREFLDRSDLFGDVRVGEGPVLASVGTCSTVRLAGVLMGTDKPDHFLGTGFHYFRRSATDPTPGVRWGTGTERSVLGWNTSSAFSRADLLANWQGWHFYATLLDPGTGPFVAEAGEVRRVRAFDWRDWVDPRWDELVYPSTYRPKVQARIAARLAEDPARWCTEAPDLAALREAAPHGPEPWILGREIGPDDPFAPLLACGER